MAKNGNGNGHASALYRYQAYRRRKRNGKGGIPRWAMALGLLAALLAIGAGATAAAGAVVYSSYADDFVPPDEAIAQLPQGGAEIRDRNGKLLFQVLDDASGLRDPVSPDEISLYVVAATVATEDASFFDNPGVNFKGLVRAAWENFSPFSDTPGFLEGSGGSSITQQLVKNVYFTPEERTDRSIDRKIRETVYALEMTDEYKKEQILVWYLNQISYGRVFVGIEEAAQGYFSKSAKELSLPEAALLAAIPNCPECYDPIAKPDAALARRNFVLRRMYEEGYLGDVDSVEAKARLWEAASTPLELDVSPTTVRAPHFVFNVVMPELERLFGEESVKQDGLVVTASIDLDVQREAERILEEHIQTYGVPAGGNNGAVVAIDPNTAEVLVYVGSRDPSNEEIEGQNDMAAALNSPGSAFKPFTYVTAFMNLGWGPGTMILDTPLDLDYWDGENPPRNPGTGYQGPITVRKALGNSLNIPAVKTILYTGVEPVKDQAKKMGITSLDRDLGPSMTIGGVDVKLVDMVYGYTVFPNLGLLKGVQTSADRPPGNRALDPVTILRVEDQDGNVLYPLVDGEPADEPPVHEERVAPAQESYLISSILSDPNAHCITYGACGALTIPGRPLAVKTGTSEPYQQVGLIGDTWTIGYTPQVVVGTWFGNADNSPMTGISSTSVSWRTVRDFAVAFHQDKPVRDFDAPDGLTEYATCIPSNLRPDDACPRTNETDLLPSHQVPDQADTWWTMARIDSRTGLLASDVTPPQYVTTRRFLDVPDNLPAFQRDQAFEWANVIGGASAGSAPTEETTQEDIPVAITSPANGAQVGDQVAFTGRANSPEFELYRLEFQQGGAGPDDWQLISLGSQRVEDGELGVWDTSDLSPGPYTVRLVLIDQDRGEIVTRIDVEVVATDEEEDGEDGDTPGPPEAVLPAEPRVRRLVRAG